MKETALERFNQSAAALLDAAQDEQLLVTRNGKPYAMIVGLDNLDDEDRRLQASPSFWRMIEERRREPTIRLDDARDDLFADTN